MTNQTPQRPDYLHFQPVTTRWQDHHFYGHVNNVTYYSFFDTAVHSYLIEHGGLDIYGGEVVGFVVSSSCDYFASVSYPELIRVGEEEACAAGRFVHVFVDRQSNQPVAIPDRLRGALQGCWFKSSCSADQ